MKQYKVFRYMIFAALGLLVFITGLLIIKGFENADGIWQILPYICIGLGSGIFGGNIGTALKNNAMRRNPQAARQIEIEQKDERNQAIRNRSKARVYDLMVFVYAAVILAFSLIQVDLFVILTLVAIYLFFMIADVYYLNKYSKEM
ncbi:MAG: hypothetical protein GXY22_05435 [Clostridiaceae bacterium]|nr:hypothetical protein [Clostridiaceae bacterium]